MGFALFLPSVDTQRLHFSPVGEFLSFASPKERNQRKGDPTSLPLLPFGYPIWRPPACAKSAALKGNNPLNRRRVKPPSDRALAYAEKPLVCRRDAQLPEGKGGWVSEFRSRTRFVCPARASSSPASGGEHRRGAEGRYTRGGLLFGYSFLATQEKVTRPQAKREASARQA
jgi:hypothetical protein